MNYAPLFDTIRDIKFRAGGGNKLTQAEVDQINAALTPSMAALSPNRFSAILTETLTHEGGWADHPKDPGGATMKGVTLRTFQDFKPGATKADLRAITDADLKAIYRKGYWDKVRGDDLLAGVDMVVFDIAVNSGPKRAAEWLQEAVGAAPDGIIGDKTLAKVKAADARSVIDYLDQRRDRFYRSLGTWSTFGKGWTARRLAVTKRAREMAG